MTPSPVELEIENTTAEGLLSFFVTYFEDIFWDRITNGDRIKRAISEEFKRLKLDLTVSSKEFLIKMMDKSIQLGETNIHRQVQKLTLPNHNKNAICLHWFKKVASIPAGGSFGERSLIKNEDRAATIVCSENCSFATLSRKDYNWIIGAAKKRELKAMVELLK